MAPALLKMSSAGGHNSQKPFASHLKNLDCVEFREAPASKWAEHISKGQTFHPARFERIAKSKSGKFNTCDENVTELYAIALDFDNKRSEIENGDYEPITHKEALAVLNKVGLKASIGYFSFSNMKEGYEKFRLVFNLREAIPKSNARKYDLLMLFLLSLFPSADKATKDLSRMFFGTNTPCFLVDDEASLDEGLLFNAYMEPYLIETRKKTIAEKAKEFGVDLVNGRPDIVINENGTITFNFIEEQTGAERVEAKKARGNKAKGKSATGSRKRIINNKIDKKASDYISKLSSKTLLSDLFNCSSVFRKWYNGEIVADHQQMLGFFTSLRFMEGGRELFIDVNRKNANKYENTERQGEEWAKTFWTTRESAYDYFPYSWETMRLTEEISVNSKNLYDALATYQVQQYIDTRPTVKTPLDEYEKNYKKTFLKILGLKEKQVLSINSETGIGKTEEYLNLNLPGRVLVLTSTHNLSGEVEIRGRDKERKIGRILARPLPHGTAGDEYIKWQKVGLEHKAKKVWDDHFRFPQNQTQEYFDYIESKKLIEDKTFDIILATHELGVRSQITSHFDYVIIDEDPSVRIIREDRTNLQDAQLYGAEVGLGADYFDYLREIQQFIDDKLVKHMTKNKTTPRMENFMVYAGARKFSPLKLYHSDAIPKSNVAGFLQAEGVEVNYKGEIRYSYRRDITSTTPICVLSATSNEEIIRNCFKDKEVFHYDLGCVEYKGKAIQYIDKTYSKHFLIVGGKPTPAFYKLVEELKKDPNWKNKIYVSFLALAEFLRAEGFNVFYLQDGKIMSFGSTEGIDALKGQNLVVIGKMSVDETTIRLWAKASGYELDYDNANWATYKRVNINGIVLKDPYMCFDPNKYQQLNQIQFWFIETHLLQAIGRVRAVRCEGAHVELYARHPLRQCEIVQ